MGLTCIRKMSCVLRRGNVEKMKKTARKSMEEEKHHPNPSTISIFYFIDNLYAINKRPLHLYVITNVPLNQIKPLKPLIVFTFLK